MNRYIYCFLIALGIVWVNLTLAIMYAISVGGEDLAQIESRYLDYVLENPVMAN